MRVDGCTHALCVASCRPRRYAPALQLSELVHVEDLKIRTLSWSLEDIWKQVNPATKCSHDTTPFIIVYYCERLRVKFAPHNKVLFNPGVLFNCSGVLFGVLSKSKTPHVDTFIPRCLGQMTSHSISVLFSTLQHPW